jgi:ferredoxin
MKQMFNFTLRVRHDKGNITIRTTASSEQAARKIVRAAEGCPDRAIRRVYHGKRIL